MDNNSATEQSMQEVTNTLEARLFGTSGGEPIATDDNEVLDDAEELPDNDDSDSEEDDGSDDVADDDSNQEMSLADYLGVDEDRIIVDKDGVFINAIIDGETKKVPLKELAMSYQLQGHVNNKSIALENERKEFEAIQQQTIALMSQKVDGLNGLSQLLESELVSEFQSIDWDRLRVENPAEWTALRQDYAERAQKVQRAQQLIHEEGLRLRDQQLAEQQWMHQQRLSQELSLMIQKNPEWVDESKRTQAQVGMRNFLTSTYNFTEQDMQYVTDHRLVQLIQDAKAYREGLKGVATKQQKQVPKFSKPGFAKDNAASLTKARDVKAKRSAVKKSGHINDVANLLIDRM